MEGAIYTLGIHDGHNCGATLSRNGEVVASVSEERLARNKNEVGYPLRAIDDVLQLGGISSADLFEVVYASEFMHRKEYLIDLDNWYRVNLSDQRATDRKPRNYEKIIFEERRKERVEAVQEHLGVP